MCDVLKQCYIKCNITSEEGAVYKIPLTPSEFMKFLLKETSDRDKLIRLAFALELDRKKFNQLLSVSQFSQELTEVKPKELIILYCIERQQYDWNLVNELLKLANEYQQEYSNNTPSVAPKLLITNIAEKEFGAYLKSVSLEFFKTNILPQCCNAAAYKMVGYGKKDQNIQYSKQSRDKLVEKSILKELGDAGNNGNTTLPETNSYLFITDIILDYIKKLNIPEQYSFHVVPKRTMSVDSYIRFFSYRMILPGAGNRNLYCMDYGSLPHELHKSVLRYWDINDLSEKPYSIKRYMIVLTTFYHSLMSQWKAGAGFIEKSQKECDDMWDSFFKKIRSDLKDIHYPAFSLKNPLDAMLKLCMLSICPLETYNRIYELNILDSLVHDPSPNPSQYPAPDRIRLVIDGLRESCRAFSEIPGTSEYIKQCKEYCRSVEKCLAALP